MIVRLAETEGFALAGAATLILRGEMDRTSGDPGFLSPARLAGRDETWSRDRLRAVATYVSRLVAVSVTAV